ncbi:MULTISPECIES: preprotein translocase subunit SecE [Butyrivibrio]|uniref:preprotein translocase subunit SecE n=1 Tax=Butyrivibrio TaxID=830 RepID=UPI0003F7D635|nr:MULTISPECIES: preprotein translocase subunit SecE [Butyrivibrio]
MEETKVVENKSKTSNKSGKSFIDKIRGFFEGVKAEIGKIIWLTKDDVVKQTTAVVVASIVCCILIAVLDYAFEEGINLLMSVSK